MEFPRKRYTPIFPATLHDGTTTLLGNDFVVRGVRPCRRVFRVGRDFDGFDYFIGLSCWSIVFGSIEFGSSCGVTIGFGSLPDTSGVNVSVETIAIQGTVLV